MNGVLFQNKTWFPSEFLEKLQTHWFPADFTMGFLKFPPKDVP
jgi:hypothetical protein